MSKIEVDTIEPQSGTSLTLGASGDTITIPSGATITNSGTATGFGKVLQVSNFVQASSVQSISSISYADLTSITLNITPSSASSKILLLSTIGVQLSSSPEGYGMQYLRDTTTIYSTNAGGYTIYSNASTELHTVNSFIYLDSPSSTSSLTYKVQVRGYNTNTVRFNDGYNSNIIAMEIAG
jgi:hypothetical protein